MIRRVSNRSLSLVFLLVLTACSNDDDSSAKTVAAPSSDVSSSPIPSAPVTAKAEIDWLDKNSMISAAPSVNEGFVNTPIGNSFPQLQIETCNLVDRISFYGEDSFSLKRGDVPDGLKRFAIVKSNVGDFIMFPDGSFVGGVRDKSETLTAALKGFPEKMQFSEESYRSFDFTQAPDWTENGTIDVQTWNIDHDREEDNGVTTYYHAIGDHTLIIFSVSGKITTYMPGTAINKHPYLPDDRYPYFYDTRYISSEDDYNSWIGTCTTTFERY